MNWQLDLGAHINADKTVSFKVWAPLQKTLQLKIHNNSNFTSPLPMQKDSEGYFQLTLSSLQKDDLYSYILESGSHRPDPVSRALPKGPFGSTQIIDPHDFSWTDQNFKGVGQDKLIFYECHVGTFTQEGTFRAILKKLAFLKELGITCLELMPIHQFSGKFGWGYDPASLFAVHNAYGTPNELKTLINSCHTLGISVCLDVVYNHFGPEGCFVGDFGPYWSETYKTPWGKAINYDGPFNYGVRHYILQNALYWLYEYHIDVLRLDALHAIFDFSTDPFLPKLTSEVDAVRDDLNKKIYLICESDLNDSRLIRPLKKHGCGFDSWWNEDFHHSLHTALIHERRGYYFDFDGLKDFKKVIQQNVVYDGIISHFRNRHHGNSFSGLRPEKFVSFLQNHDQIGNRPKGDRLSAHLTFEKEKLAAFLLLMSPYLPLLFMGQEYSEEAPFEYFVDYQDKELLQKVYEGRKREFYWSNLEIQNPDVHAFLRSKLRWDLNENEKNKALFNLYKKLIRLRRKYSLTKKQIHLLDFAHENTIVWEYQSKKDWIGIFCYLGDKEMEFILPHAFQGSDLILHTKMTEFGGNNKIHFDKAEGTLRLLGSTACLFHTQI